MAASDSSPVPVREGGLGTASNILMTSEHEDSANRYLDRGHGSLERGMTGSLPLLGSSGDPEIVFGSLNYSVRAAGSVMDPVRSVSLGEGVGDVDQSTVTEENSIHLNL